MERLDIVATGTLAAKPPFDFAKSLRFIAAFPMTNREQTIEDGVLRKGALVDGIPLLCALREREGEIAYEIRAKRRLTPERIERAETLLRRYLSLDDDLEPFYAIARDDAPFRSLLREGHGFHHVRFFTPIEITIWSMLAQRSPMARARAIKRDFMERFGATISFEGHEYPIFPEVKALAHISLGDIEAVVRNPVKAQRIHGAVAAFAGIEDAFLYDAPIDEVRAFLRDIPGIGPWSENFITLRGLGRMEWCAGTDALREAAQTIYGDRATARAIAGRLAAYGDYQGYWAFYLRAVPALAHSA